MLPPTPRAPSANRLYFEAPFEAAIRQEELPRLRLGHVLVRTRLSAVSAGTEMLFYRGQAPGGMAIDSTLASLSGEVQYPLRYGYACVGIVERVGAGVDDGWLGRRVFAFEPHASTFVAPAEALIAVPDDIDDEAAALLPNAETATNLLLDGAPLLGERAALFGAGVVGLLTTAWLSRFPLARLVVVDPSAQRRAHALHLGAHKALPSANTNDLDDADPTSGESLRNFDLVYELSGNPRALDEAIQVAGFGARVVVGSWYGSKAATLDLGGHFHRNRVQISSSQVSTLAPALTGRWDKPRRIAQAWELLRAVDTASLITHRVPFMQAPDAYRMIDQQPSNVLQLLFSYG
jgi:2-desacetyl-2-hydroxyethyl bacteriochlorophyllide A dehydrogenase